MTKLLEWEVDVGQRDAVLADFLKGTPVDVPLSKRIKDLQAQLVRTKDYVSRQGATVTPRPFWVVEVVTARRRTGKGGEDIVPLLMNDTVTVASSRKASLVQGQGKRKETWRGCTIRGSVSTRYVFGLVTSRYVGSFSILHRDLCVLPAKETDGGLDVMHHLASKAKEQRALVEEDGELKALRVWVREAQTFWKQKRKEDQQELCTERLDYQRTLSHQPPNGFRVVHTRSGNFYAALLRPSATTTTGFLPNELKVKSWRNGKIAGEEERKIGGCVVDNLLHWIGVSSIQEGHWLVAILNSEPFIKRLDSELHGRDTYSAPSRILADAGLRFDPSDAIHLALADRAKLIESTKLIYDRRMLVEECGKEVVESIDDSDVTPELPRLKWTFEELCHTDPDVAASISKINSLVAKIL